MEARSSSPSAWDYSVTVEVLLTRGIRIVVLATWASAEQLYLWLLIALLQLLALAATALNVYAFLEIFQRQLWIPLLMGPVSALTFIIGFFIKHFQSHAGLLIYGLLSIAGSIFTAFCGIEFIFKYLDYLAGNLVYSCPQTYAFITLTCTLALGACISTLQFYLAFLSLTIFRYIRLPTFPAYESINSSSSAPSPFD